MIIPLVHTGSSGGRFPMAQLPADVQGAVLQFLVVPRVVSSSMAPTLLPEDALELESPADLRIGDLLVFRHHEDYVCHRLIDIQGSTLLVKGDATTGEAEPVDRSHLVGRVSAVIRGSSRRESLPLPRRSATGRLRISLRAALSETLRHPACLRLGDWCLRRPVVRQAVAWLVRRCLTVDILEPAPLRSTESFVLRSSFRFSKAHHGVIPSGSLPSRESLLLLLRLGPMVLGTCRCSPWSVSFHPGARALHLEEGLEMLAKGLPKWPASQQKTVGTLRT